MSKYQELLQHLYSINRFSGMKLGLTNILKLLQLMGNPHHKIPVIHVAGTNGKGSVSTKIASALQEAGYTVGLFTSPHISSFRERIRLQGDMISESAVAHHLEHIFSLNIEATYFEYVTALMFAFFAEKKVDFAVVEAGIGGRFDATNVCMPHLSVITSISLDHTSILGNTIEAITLEKAGIIKPNIPVVIGPRVDVELIKKKAQELHATVFVVDAVATHFEEENCAIARKALEILSVPNKAIEKGLQDRPPCRFEVVPKRFTHYPEAVVLDVAHNPDGIEKLFSRLKIVYPNLPLYVVYGASGDKDIEACLQTILLKARRTYFMEAKSERRAKREDLEKTASKIAPTSIFESVQSIEKPFFDAANDRACLVVCGTFFIMGEVRAFLGYKEAQDAFDLNECKVELCPI